MAELKHSVSKKKNMANRYGIIYQGRKLALAYVSPHPEYQDHIMVSVILLECEGKWEDNSLELKLEKPLHDIFPTSKSEVEAVQEVISQVAIEPWKIEVRLVDNW
ncbi:MAG TPA: hypothetical protein PKY67_00600 [Nitrosomonas sp.]|nr:hypothetical protein [Nitrosomonas sp.]